MTDAGRLRVHGIELEVLRTIIERALNLHRLEDENRRLAAMPARSPIERIVTGEAATAGAPACRAATAAPATDHEAAIRWPAARCQPTASGESTAREQSTAAAPGAVAVPDEAGA